MMYTVIYSVKISGIIWRNENNHIFWCWARIGKCILSHRELQCFCSPNLWNLFRLLQLWTQVLPEIGYQLLHNYAEQIQTWGWICNIHSRDTSSFAKYTVFLYISSLIHFTCLCLSENGSIELDHYRSPDAIDTCMLYCYTVFFCSFGR